MILALLAVLAVSALFVIITVLYLRELSDRVDNLNHRVRIFEDYLGINGFRDARTVEFSMSPEYIKLVEEKIATTPPTPEGRYRLGPNSPQRAYWKTRMPH